MLKVIAGAKDINNQGDCRQITTVINTKTPKRLPRTFGLNKIAGLEVNVEGLDELHLELGLDRLQVSHITTSFKSFGRKT